MNIITHYLLFLTKKHPSYKRILLQIFPQVFQVSYRYLKANIQKSLRYEQRFERTSQNFQLQNDPNCRIILKAIVQKKDQEYIRNQFNVKNMEQMYPFNQNNYFLIYACARLQDINHDSTHRQFQKIAKIINLPPRQIQFIIQHYKDSAWMACRNKFNFLKQNKQHIWDILSPFLKWILTKNQLKTPFASLQNQMFKDIPSPEFQLYSTEIWLKYLQIQSKTLKLQEYEQSWVPLNKHSKDLSMKLEKLLINPSYSLNCILFRQEEKFLRQIYFNRKFIQIPKFYYSQTDWEFDYLGKRIKKSNIQNAFQKTLIIQQKSKKQQQQIQQVLIEQLEQQKEKNKLQKVKKIKQAKRQVKQEFQIQEKMQIQRIQNQYTKVQGIKCQETDKLNSDIEMNDAQSFQNCQLSKDSEYFKLWLIFLMKKAKHFDKKICNQRFGLFKRQTKQIAKKKRKIKLFTRYFPQKLEKSLLKMKKNTSRDPDQRKLLRIIYNKLKNVEPIEKTDQLLDANRANLFQNLQQNKIESLMKKINTKLLKQNRKNKSMPLRGWRGRFIKSNLTQNKSRKLKLVNSQCQILLKNQLIQERSTKSDIFQQNSEYKPISLISSIPYKNKKIKNEYNSQNLSQIKEQKNENIQSKQNKISKKSLEVIQKDLCVYLCIKIYSLQDPIIQYLLQMRVNQIVQYYSQRKEQIQQKGNQYIQILKANPKIWQSFNNFFLIQALTKKYMKQLQEKSVSNKMQPEKIIQQEEILIKYQIQEQIN